MDKCVVNVKIEIGDYEITPHPTFDGRVFIEIRKVTGQDSHVHSIGVEKTIIVDDLFKDVI